MKTKQGKEISVGDLVAYTHSGDSYLSWFKVYKVHSDELQIYNPIKGGGYHYIDIEMVEAHQKSVVPIDIA